MDLPKTKALMNLTRAPKTPANRIPVGVEESGITGIMDAVIHAGSQAALGRELGVTWQAVSQWLRQGYVPVGRVTQIETLYGIPRERLLNPKYVESLTPPNFTRES